MQITYTHRVKRSYRLSFYPNPKPPAHRFNCHCQWHPYRIICPSCLSQTSGLTSRSSVPVTWARINGRANNRCLADLIGGIDPLQDTDLLTAWGIQPSDIEEVCGLKSVEQYAVFSRGDTTRLINTIRMCFVRPCPNQILEGAWLPERDRDPDEDAEWSDGTKNILFQAELANNNLPLRSCGMRYFLSVYQIERTPEYPAKIELTALASGGKWIKEDSLKPLRKAMHLFLLGVLKAAGVAPQVIPEGLKMQGEPCRLKERGRKVNPDDVRRAAALSDMIDFGGDGYPFLRRETLLAALCCCLGRPLDANTLSEVLNGVTGRSVFRRVPGRYSYERIPPTATMERLQRVVSAMLVAV